MIISRVIVLKLIYLKNLNGKVKKLVGKILENENSLVGVSMRVLFIFLEEESSKKI